MAKKEYVAFPALVCERLRGLVRLEREAKAKREDLFMARDNAEEEFIAAADAPAKEHAAAEFGRYVMEIERWNSAIKAIAIEKNNVIEKADEPSLYDEPTVKIGEFMPTPKAHDPQKRIPDGRPVGRPTAREPEGNSRGRAIADGYVEGVAEHLRAPVAALRDFKVSAEICGKCAKAGVATVAQVAEWFDESCPDGVIDSLAAAEVKALGAGLRAYRAMHGAAAPAKASARTGVI